MILFRSTPYSSCNIARAQIGRQCHLADIVFEPAHHTAKCMYEYRDFFEVEYEAGRCDAAVLQRGVVALCAGHGPRQFARIDAPAQRFAEMPAEVSIIAVFAVVDELRNAARKDDAVDVLQLRDRAGQVEVHYSRRRCRFRESGHQIVRHGLGDRVERRGCDRIADMPMLTGAGRVAPVSGENDLQRTAALQGARGRDRRLARNPGQAPMTVESRG